MAGAGGDNFPELFCCFMDVSFFSPVVPGDSNATANPVRGYALELAQKKGRGKRQFRRVMKNAVFQIIHLWLLFSICLTSYESNMTAVRENFESRIVSGSNGITSINRYELLHLHCTL